MHDRLFTFSWITIVKYSWNTLETPMRYHENTHETPIYFPFQNDNSLQEKEFFQCNLACYFVSLTLFSIKVFLLKHPVLSKLASGTNDLLAGYLALEFFFIEIFFPPTEQQTVFLYYFIEQNTRNLILSIFQREAIFSYLFIGRYSIIWHCLLHPSLILWFV